MTMHPRWSAPRRLLCAVGGALLATIPLLLGSTILAQGAGIGRTGAIIAFWLLAASPAGLYLLAAAYWGAWSPRGHADRRVRTIRIALVWALIVGVYLTSSVPWLEASAMTRREWVNGSALAALTAMTLVALSMIRRRPRATALGLLPAGLFGSLVLANIASIVLGPDASQWSGPARTLSLLVSGSYAAALLVAAILAWPLRREPTANTT
jgi:hypothetical protein